MISSPDNNSFGHKLNTASRCLHCLASFKKEATREEDAHDNRVAETTGPGQVLDPGRLGFQGDTIKRYGLSDVRPAASSDTVDVICVHGLMGHPRETWTKHKKGFLWPAHVTEDIDDIRVLTFGYDADPVSVLGRAGQNRLGEHAQGLLNEAARKREKTNTEDRPIIWIAHSLGGLVVEKALTIGDTCPEYEKHLKKIADNTIGIITLGTPHAGSNLAEWAEITTRLLRSVHANRDIVGVLTKDSQVLQDTNNAFARFLATRNQRNSRIEIQRFHETLATSNVGVVVSIASASIFGFTSDSIDTNHMEMTKFSSREDPGYEKIIGTVRRWQKEWQSSVTEDDQHALQGAGPF